MVPVVHCESVRKSGVPAALVVLAVLLGGCGEQSVNLCGVGVRGKLIHYRADDGLQLMGAAAGRGDRGIVFANGWNVAPHGRIVPVSFRIALPTSGIYCTWLSDPRLARRLVRSGFELFLFDYRGTGRSDAGPGAAAHRYDLDVAAVVEAARERLDVPGVEPEYVEVVSARDLTPLDHLEGEILIAVAARVGRARLIDNIVVDAGSAQAAQPAVAAAAAVQTLR
jgi:pimeloyl-ACP methyl ester carboxylesterase